MGALVKFSKLITSNVRECGDLICLDPKKDLTDETVIKYFHLKNTDSNVALRTNLVPVIESKVRSTL